MQTLASFKGGGIPQRAHWQPTTTVVYNRDPMHPARIAELLQPFLSNPCHSEPAKAGEESAVLSAIQLQSISTYIDILLHWNARINLTAIRAPEEIVTRHFGESLFAARHLFPPYPVSSSVSPVPPVVRDFEVAEAQSPKPEARLADLGSGAGFPGVPIKLWAPNIALTLIESNQKKATFLRELTRTLTLTDVNIKNTRAEALPPSTFDVVTLRAVERLPKILPVAANLPTPNGRLALLISSSQLESTRSTLPNLIWDPPIPIPNSESRILLVGQAEPRL
ncbi:MAG: 16S rRNA (guanine(527)-N(7))-methyltransferase RsmG [Candidatus Sulfotelmatobacter sp.]